MKFSPPNTESSVGVPCAELTHNQRWQPQAPSASQENGHNGKQSLQLAVGSTQMAAGRVNLKVNQAAIGLDLGRIRETKKRMVTTRSSPRGGCYQTRPGSTGAMGVKQIGQQNWGGVGLAGGWDSPGACHWPTGSRGLVHCILLAHGCPSAGGLR